MAVPKACFRNRLGNLAFDIEEFRSSVGPTHYIARPFKFSKVQKVDDDNSDHIARDARRAKGLGEILVEVHHVKCYRAKPNKLLTHREVSGVSGEISEKALKGKAISHGVSYGAEKRVEFKRSEYKSSYVDGKDKPYAVFLFKYRSRNLCKQSSSFHETHLLVSLPSQKVTNETLRDGDIALGARSQIHETRSGRISRLKAELAEAKAELGNNYVKVEETKEVKRELEDDDIVISSSRARKTTRDAKGRTFVDLTEDD